MEIKELSASLLGGMAGDYLQQKEGSVSFFDYPLSEDVFQKRAKDLQGRSYPRRELVFCLLDYNEKLGAGAKTIENIRALADEDTLVVVAGQQAGILTGPLYTIHKIVSIIQLAKEQEQKLGVRVIPVFWIAGEDHDIDEINHVHIMKNGKIKKAILPQEHIKKMSASQTALDYDLCLAWVENVFKTFPETNHTNAILRFVKECLARSGTYTDFFAYIITGLFKEEGLVLVDSDSQQLRKCEAPFFQQLLQQHTHIQQALAVQQEALRQTGYQPIITTKPSSIHLFVHIDGERWLLEKNGDWLVCKDGEYRFTYEQLLQIAEETPERLSNNVVTRPLMQEYLFPTLAFIGGPGEVAYWGELREVFRQMDFIMPPVVPRLMISYLERNIETDLQDLHITEEEVFTERFSLLREKWLAGHGAESIKESFTAAHVELERIHAQLRELAERVNPTLAQFAGKNKRKLEEQLQILERAIEKDIERKHAAELEKFNRIESSLRPIGLLQERVWNIFYYLNKYGFDFIVQLLELPFSRNASHKVVKL
ncbi:MAG: bacillithiol biosynthesis cysteine-adding enzyme BshC [Ectobacillus sp.]